MVIKVIKFKCERCGKEYDIFEDAKSCENIDKLTGDGITDEEEKKA